MGGIAMRKFALFATLVVLMTAVAAPASATRPDPDSDFEVGHKITICHATRSLSNPYVKITIDVAAWDLDDTDDRAHGPDHHARVKDGEMWADYGPVSEEDECVIDPPVEPPPTERQKCTWTEEWVDHVIAFDGTKLITGNPVRTSEAVDIAAGTYDLVLFSSDPFRGGSTVQAHEQWRLVSDNPSDIPSFYSDDLADDGLPKSNEETTGVPVTFANPVTTATAEHWSVDNTSSDPADRDNSVVPVGACLTLN
jgi:hypothetical protein